MAPSLQFVCNFLLLFQLINQNHQNYLTKLIYKSYFYIICTSWTFVDDLKTYSITSQRNMCIVCVSCVISLLWCQELYVVHISYKYVIFTQQKLPFFVQNCNFLFMFHKISCWIFMLFFKKWYVMENVSKTAFILYFNGLNALTAKVFWSFKAF